MQEVSVLVDAEILINNVTVIKERAVRASLENVVIFR